MAEFKEVIRQNNEKGGPKPKKGTKNPSLKFNDPLYAVKEEAEEGNALDPIEEAQPDDEDDDMSDFDDPERLAHMKR